MAPITPLNASQQKDAPTLHDIGTDVVASLTIAERLPFFWTDSPRLWFSQFEAIIAPHKQGDDYKYNAVIAKLPKEVIHQVSDLLHSPPENDKYATIKNRLISCYEESEHRRFHKLLSEMDLGDSTPSQLLRRMKEASCGKMNDDTLRLLWFRQLPTSLTSILAVSDNIAIEKLSEMADRIYENMRYKSRHSPKESVNIDVVEKLMSQILAMRMEINELRSAQHKHQPTYSRGRSRNRTPHSFARSRSKSTNRLNKNGNCFYHNKFGIHARHCQQPCTWRVEKAMSGNEQ